jgi:transcriptional regulator with XRE-family HTH domain
MGRVSHIADLLRHHMERRGLTQRSLAAASGAKQGTIGPVLSGKCPLPLPAAELIADALELDDEERRTFISTARRAKAMSQLDAVAYIEELEQRLRSIERILPALLELITHHQAQLPQRFLHEAQTVFDGAQTPDLGSTDR